jgi:murein DD-endopeptidase MepM/ murein hydrolase activator NlpD
MTDSILASVRALATSPAAADAQKSADPQKVRELATQFEGLLMSQMMKDLKLSLGGEDDDADKGSDIGPLADVMTSELGLALSRAGGLGIADFMAGALAKQAPVAPTTDASGDASAEAQGADLNGLPSEALVAAPAATVAVSSPSTSMTAMSNGARVSSQFGWRSDPIDGQNKFHKGMDVAVAQGSTVYAPADGKVVSVGQQTGYGLTVVVKHANGVETRYAHLSAAEVRTGDSVTAGEPIALSGNTGRSTGAHLHFELLSNGQAVDPSGWVDSVVSGPAAALRAQATR